MSNSRSSTELDSFILPNIRTALPGPKTKALIDRDQKVISPSYTRGYPLAITEGRGAMVTDPDGNRFLDFCAGIAVCATGHSHPEVVRAISEQAAKFIHMSGTDFYYTCTVELAEKLAKSTPGPPDKKVFFGNSGTETIEGAMKLARYHTRRPNFIAFYKSFHGRTFGSMSLTASKATQRKHFAPLVPGVFHAHYPYLYRDVFGSKTPEECVKNSLNFIENTIFKTLTPPEDVAAIIVEPIQGEGGYVVPPDGFLTGLQALAKKYSILVIADEVQSGMGRTGQLWASLHEKGFEPDILCSAKGLASGLPLGAIIARSAVMDWEPGTHATTFGGNPVACASALKTLELLEGGLLKNAQTQGAELRKQLETLCAESDLMGEVRGRGLMLGVEIVESKASKAKAPALRDRIVDACFENGLVILGCGENTIRFCPPLVICKEQVDAAVGIFRYVLQSGLNQ